MSGQKNDAIYAATVAFAVAKMRELGWMPSSNASTDTLDGSANTATPSIEQADGHARICSKLAEQYKSDPVLFAALTDAAAIIRDLMGELRRETERRWEGNRRAAQDEIRAGEGEQQ